MAIGDVQNRYDVVHHALQAGGAANVNRQQVRPPEEQENRISQQAANQPDFNNNVNTNQTYNAPRITQAPGEAPNPNQSEQEIVELGNQTQQTQNAEVQNHDVNDQINSTNVIRRTEEEVLYETNHRDMREITPAGENEEENPAAQAVERTAEEQIGRIENANTTAANTPAHIAAAVNALTQENQLGANLNIIA